MTGDRMTRVLLIALVWLFLLGTNAIAQSPLDALSPEDIEDGQRLYRIHCARCHGIDGAGGEGSNLVRARLKHAGDDQALIDLLGSGIPGTGMPGIWTLDDAQRTRVAGYVRTLGRLPTEEMPGDPQRGEDVYASRGGCPACHIVAGIGTGIGPELSDVGDRRGLAYLTNSLTDPAAEQSQTGGYLDYLAVRVRTANRRVEGLRVAEDAFTVQVRDVSGQLHSFRKDRLLEYEKAFRHSLMPDYEAVLSAQDTRDVVSYLMSLRSEPQ